MSDSVQLLWFVRDGEDGEDTELLSGVYGTEQDARAAIERLRDKPGFAEFQEGFEIARYKINEDHWTEGFVTV